MDNKALSAAADRFGTPIYVFDSDSFARRCREVKSAIGCHLCYCVKANPFLTACLPDTVSQLEACSPGELEICRDTGVCPDMILFSGVNKTRCSVDAALDYGVRLFTAESLGQLRLIDEAGWQRGIKIPLLLRLTAGDQFGMDEADIRFALSHAGDFCGVELMGLHYFSGTQKSKAGKIQKELEYLISFADSLKAELGFDCRRLEYGPGLFADYFGDNPEGAEEKLLVDTVPLIEKASRRFDLTVELGRFLAAPCGAYLTSVHEIKQNHGESYAILDGGIHQLHYDGQVMGMRKAPIQALSATGQPTEYTLCGSLCSTGDKLAQSVTLPRLEAGDVLAFGRAGAYCVTEGQALFLSRELPGVVIYSQETDFLLARDFTPTWGLCNPKIR